MAAMNKDTNLPETTVEMLEKARRVLELTYCDWGLHERPVRTGKAARKARRAFARGYDHGWKRAAAREGLPSREYRSSI